MVFGIIGPMGSGKTQLMSFLGYALSVLYNVPLYSTYHLKGSKILDKRLLLTSSNAIMCLDEMWLNVDSRLWKDNVFLTRWFNQTRKKSLLIFYTSQDLSQMDKRFRIGTDYFITCRQFKDKTFGGYKYRYRFIEGYSGELLSERWASTNSLKPFYDMALYDTLEFVNTLQ